MDIKYHEIGNSWTLVSASAWKNSTNSTIGGVGLLLSPRALKSLKSAEKITQRIILATFSGNPATTVICCYSPTNVSDKQEILNFYDELSAIVRSIPKHNLLVIGGDMNAHIGREDNKHKFSFHDGTNRNGEYLLTFLLENNLQCMNTRFQKRPGKLWTHQSPNGDKAQLDYLFMNKKWINSCHNCEAYSSFYGVSTDHRIVTSKLKLSLRANKTKKSSRQPYNWSTLSHDNQIKQRFIFELRNRFDALQAQEQEPTANTTYENFVRSHQEAAKKCIPLKPKVKPKGP